MGGRGWTWLEQQGGGSEEGSPFGGGSVEAGPKALRLEVLNAEARFKERGVAGEMGGLDSSMCVFFLSQKK